MKGDVAWDVSCPLCGDVLHPRSARERKGGGWVTPRRLRRKAINQHLHHEHPRLSPREKSLLLDRVVP
jgi:hypothetical protein